MEQWDLYTWDRQKTGEFHTRGEKLPPDRYHMVVQVVIFNSEGQMLIQRRQKDKIGWPDKWDFSAAGSAVAGDDSVQAALREVQEEIGVTLELSDLHLALTMHDDDFFCDFYMVRKDIALESLSLQAEEVQDARWASEEEILALVDKGEFVTWVRPLVPLLFAIRETGRIRI